MSLFDGILGQLEGSDGGQAVLNNLAAKVGLTPEQVQGAIGALASAHVQPGDTVQAASASTGLSQEVMQQVLHHLGGEGALGSIVERMMAGQGQAGGEQGGLGGMLGNLASGFFGNKS